MKCKTRYCRREAGPKQGYCPPCHARIQTEQVGKRRVSEQMRISLEQMKAQVEWMKRNNLTPSGAE